MELPFTPPQFNKTSFNCPHCNAFANMDWDDAYQGYLGKMMIRGLKSAKCVCCDDYSLWIDGLIVYPEEISVELPNKDLPEDIKEDYLEAANIMSKSPRGSSALLRLSIEKLVNFLDAQGKDLNAKIGYLVSEKALNPKIQKALDVVRVVGNNAVHPGQIDLKDNQDIAGKLFRLVNIIAKEMITEPNEVNSIYEELIPEENKNGILKRDSN
ncbi:DUF4145 domain-containing protein [Candidatus Peregrinibacteria bacterium]|nr:DUF4145 domain-containing protein [Candidatus Peregrinibacteria bacterium]